MDGQRGQLGRPDGHRADEAPHDHGHGPEGVLVLSDSFEERYTEGILDEVPPSRNGDPLWPTPPLRRGAFALRGCVLTPKKKLDDGYVVVNGATIASVDTKKPAGVKVIETDGVVVPGLIDLHGHPEYNVFSAWEPPKLYANRYRWRDSKEYQVVVREPWKKLVEDPRCSGISPAMPRRALSSAVQPRSRAQAEVPREGGGARPQRRPAHLRRAQGDR